MNTRIKALIASGLLFATALPVVACARKAPEAKLLPTAEPSIIETTDTEIEQKAVEINVPVEFQDPIVETVPAESSIMIKESKKQAETKKSTKKETKTTKKTAKKTKKAKKTNKKSDKKSDKKTTAPKFAYGSSSYTAKNIKITVHIKKDNKVEVSVVNNRPNKSDKTYYVYEFSGKINPDTGLFTYSNGSVKCVVDVHIRRESVLYRNNASGYMTFNGNNLTWFDGAQHCADGVTFHKQ